MKSQPVEKRRLIPILLRMLISGVLAFTACWAVAYNWRRPLAGGPHHTYADKEARRLRVYPRAQFAEGMRAWLRQKPERAAGFFRQAVTGNVMYVDAWLKLAEAEAAVGRKTKARQILTFTTAMTGHAIRWQWPQLLLADELGMNTKFDRLANELLARRETMQDTLQLLHTHFNGDAAAVVAVLKPVHLSAYLDWLMRWGMARESLTVWQALTAGPGPQKQTALHYADFLLNHKRIVLARDIWRQYTGITGLTNPGFESPLTDLGFGGHRYGKENDDWEIKRVHADAAQGGFALRTTFKGQSNISFQHLYQIVATDPQAKYRLRYEWKCAGITTDQGPFVEVFGYNKSGLYKAGEMMTGFSSWHEDAIEFDTPAGCHGAVVRLRRRPSMHFDSKISGSIWLDNFRLEKIDVHQQAGY
jgi:hypothetical protein